jgi:CO/xanthine dehydrogenase Mo-binding subunit
VAERLEIPIKKVRVIKPRIGGGFGAKQEVLAEDIVAAAVLKTRRPVKYFMTRSEEFLSRTRHPMIVRMKVGTKKDGTLTAISMKVLMNTGAYGSHALTVVCNAGSKVLPLYNKVKHVEFMGDTVYTNLPVGGAYRGYGATQGAYGMESILDELSREIGIDPVKLRQINHIRTGEGSPVFAALGEGKAGVEQKIGSCGLDRCIEQGAAAFGWESREDRRSKGLPPYKKRGFGMCTLMQGSSIPEIDMGAAFMKMNDDGSFNLHVGATDLGTGSDTVLAQIAAEALGCPVEEMVVYSSDTDMTPFDVGAYASSTTYLSGMAAKKCAEEVRGQILSVAADMLEKSRDDLYIENARVFHPDGGSVTFGQVARRALYEKDQHQIGALTSHITHKSPPPFAAHFVEVEVDTETGQVEVKRYICAIDCGTAIHPRLAEGQCEGAVLNGISYAMTEEYLFDKKGRMMNDSFGTYKIFNTRDLPELKVILVPTYEETGPYGAKSVSEININGALPAIGNAIFDAVGARIRATPYTPEKVLAAIKGIK